MRVFVTGGTGFVGSAVVQELLDAGHEVVGLARSDASAEALASMGVAVRRGYLNDLDGLRAGAADADGVVHAGYVHDFSSAATFAASAGTDLRAVQAMGTALEGSDRPLVIAAGIGLLRPGHAVTEEVVGDPERSGARVGTENELVAMADRGVRSVAIRLPPTVHGEGDHGFVPIFIQTARDRGTSAYVGDGTNRWSTVHRLDAARLFRLALEGAAAGSRLHAVAEEGVPFRDIAEIIGRHLDVPVRGIHADDTGAHFGFLGAFAAADLPASSAATRRLMGWEPTQPDLLSDLDEGHYFG